MLNTIVADTLCEIADELEKADDVKAAAQKILQEIATKHARIIFNGDNYTEEWVAEAEKRGLPNIRSTYESLTACPLRGARRAVRASTAFSPKEELHARTEILLERYSKEINIEALTMLNMAKRQILPACCEYSAKLGKTVAAVTGAGVGAETQKKLLKRVCDLIATMESRIEALEKATAKAAGTHGAEKHAQSYREDVLPAMVALRQTADELETIVDARLWPLPTYAEMLFVR